jgi:hypothetical protein
MKNKGAEMGKCKKCAHAEVCQWNDGEDNTIACKNFMKNNNANVVEILDEVDRLIELLAQGAITKRWFFMKFDRSDRQYTEQ